jgi:hypothetical protein
MKRIIRDQTKYFKAKAFNALRDINPTRLKLMAAIAIEFTSLEGLIDFALRTLLKFEIDETEVISRINGFEGKVAIIKSIIRDSATLKGEPATMIAGTLGEISVLKTYRDAVAHADIHEPEAQMARTSIKHGKPYEVDISIRTLRALFGRIVEFQNEMVDALRVIEHHFSEWDLEDAQYADASVVINGQIFQQHLRQLRKRQTRRKSLPIIPKLSEEPPPQLAAAGS